MQHKAKTKNPLLTASPIKGLLMVSCVSYKKIKFFSVVRSCLVKGSRGSSDLLIFWGWLYRYIHAMTIPLVYFSICIFQ